MLDEIKEAVKHDCFHNDGIMISVTFKEMIWLMEQVEKLEKIKSILTDDEIPLSETIIKCHMVLGEK
jgi:hypothetical protein